MTEDDYDRAHAIGMQLLASDPKASPQDLGRAACQILIMAAAKNTGDHCPVCTLDMVQEWINEVMLFELRNRIGHMLPPGQVAIKITSKKGHGNDIS